MKHFEMLAMADILSRSSVKVYPYTKGFQEAQMKPFAIFHTPGSIVFPKLVVIVHGSMAACDAYQNAHVFGYARTQVDIFNGKRIFPGLPPYHAAGMFHSLAMPIFYGSIPVVGPPTVPTAALVSDILKYGDISILVVRPDVVGVIADDSDLLERLGALDYVMNAACALPKRLRYKIASKTCVTKYMGATETLLALELPNGQDWEYITPSDVMEAEFRHHHGDLYELSIVRRPTLMAYQVVFYTFPHLQEHSMKNLYPKHPTEPRPSMALQGQCRRCHSTLQWSQNAPSSHGECDRKPSRR